MEAQDGSSVLDTVKDVHIVCVFSLFCSRFVDQTIRTVHRVVFRFYRVIAEYSFAVKNLLVENS